MILVIADSFDAHADLVENHLQQHGAEYVRLNLNVQALERTLITYSESDDSWEIEVDDITFSTDEVSCVWARRLTIEKSDLDACNSIGEEKAKLWIGEWTRALHWLFYSLEDRAWLPPFRRAIRAEHKYLQLRAAKRAGLQTPPTLLSSHPDRVNDFASGQRTALKSLSQDFYEFEGQKHGLFTNVLDESDFDEFSSDGEAPLFLQEYVPKAFEVRVTSIERNHLACKIDSQANERTSVDWRRYNIPQTPHHAMELPSDITSKLDRIMDILELNFGASDFIVSQSGGWYFLEINTNGQWLWIEQLTGLSIAKYIAEYLVRVSSNEAV